MRALVSYRYTYFLYFILLVSYARAFFFIFFLFVGFINFSYEKNELFVLFCVFFFFFQQLIITIPNFACVGCVCARGYGAIFVFLISLFYFIYFNSFIISVLNKFKLLIDGLIFINKKKYWFIVFWGAIGFGVILKYEII